MTYVEEMALKMYEESSFWPIGSYQNFIDDIIADTKRAHRIAILDEVDAPYTEKQAYLAVIEQAEVKGE